LTKEKIPKSSKHSCKQVIESALHHSPIMVENVGQLALKEEAAGKIRVFALVDV
jgi:hypothetical protein